MTSIPITLPWKCPPPPPPGFYEPQSFREMGIESTTEFRVVYGIKVAGSQNCIPCYDPNYMTRLLGGPGDRN